MLRGLYESAMGMNARLTLQDVIANNLANVNSTGFQREMIAIQSRPMAHGADVGGTGSAANAALSTEVTLFRDTQPGVQQETGNRGDVALEGRGYLVAQTANGPRLFRSGSLQANAQGNLALPTGQLVEGVGGAPIRVGSANWTISAQGNIEAGGQVLGRLHLVQAQGDVIPEGGGFSTAASVTDLPPGAIKVRGGYLEHSNVDPIHEMVEMIAGMRAYEAGQRAIQAQDQTLQNLFTLLQ